jgi:hydroxylamine reductase
VTAAAPGRCPGCARAVDAPDRDFRPAIASALADAFGTDVNSLPLSLVLSWYEQKAVSILLTLLHLGIRNIRLGPSLPAFVTPQVLGLLAETYGIMPIGTPEGDLKAILG